MVIANLVFLMWILNSWCSVENGDELSGDNLRVNFTLIKLFWIIKYTKIAKQFISYQRSSFFLKFGSSSPIQRPDYESDGARDHYRR
jgi:hypothetical protein